MKPLSIQLYTVRELAKQDFLGTLNTVADIGFAGVELAGLHDRKPEEVRKVLDDLGLKASSAHGEFPGPDLINRIADTAHVLGYSHYAVPWIGPHRFVSIDEIKRTAGILQAAAEALAPHGVRLMYHNHEHEMRLVDGQVILDVFLRYMPDVDLEIDTYWAANFGRNDPAAFVRKHADRVPLLHIKDGQFIESKRVHVAAGQGKMDLPAVIAAADEKVAQWIVLELDSCDTDMLTAVRESYSYLTKNKLASGRK